MNTVSNASFSGTRQHQSNGEATQNTTKTEADVLIIDCICIKDNFSGEDHSQSNGQVETHEAGVRSFKYPSELGFQKYFFHLRLFPDIPSLDNINWTRFTISSYNRIFAVSTPGQKRQGSLFSKTLIYAHHCKNFKQLCWNQSKKKNVDEVSRSARAFLTNPGLLLKIPSIQHSILLSNNWGSQAAAHD